MKDDEVGDKLASGLYKMIGYFLAIMIIIALFYNFIGVEI